jgi:hypothetical protein
MTRVNLLLVVLFFSATALADELSDSLARVRELSAAGNYPRAMKEAEGVQKELRTRHERRLAGFFPDVVAEFRAEPARGVSRSYRKGDLTIEVVLQEFSATQRAMLDMAQWGMRMGAQMMSETLNLEGCPASLEARPGQDTAAMTIELANHARLRLELRGSSDGTLLKTFAGSLRLGELDRYLRAE